MDQNAGFHPAPHQALGAWTPEYHRPVRYSPGLSTLQEIARVAVPRKARLQVSANSDLPALRRADHVCIRVEDFGRALAWYTEKLGLTVDRIFRIEGMPGTESAYLNGPGGFRVEIVGGGESQRRSAAGNFMEQINIQGFTHVSFWSDDVDATMAELERRGVPVVLPPIDSSPAGIRAAFVRDADGNLIEFVGPMKSSS